MGPFGPCQAYTARVLFPCPMALEYIEPGYIHKLMVLVGNLIGHLQKWPMISFLDQHRMSPATLSI